MRKRLMDRALSGRRFALCLVGAMLLAPCSSAHAQQPASKIHRIGWIALYGSKLGRDVGSFLDGLRERGYVEGRNITIEYRSARGRRDRLPEIAAELVRLNVDVIVETTNAATHAVREATTTIPIVSIYSDPVGMVSSPVSPGQAGISRG
jgi:putative ABC transport system substrate-binding protein